MGTVDQEVVRAHIVPDVLLFTRPQLRRAAAHPTLQFNSSRHSIDLRVMAKLDMRNNGESQSLIGRDCLTVCPLVPVVESITTVGTKKHKRGSVRANIVKGNIPVQNGIVHLIDRPLVVMANSLHEHLCVKKTDVSSELRAHCSLQSDDIIVCRTCSDSPSSPNISRNSPSCARRSVPRQTRLCWFQLTRLSNPSQQTSWRQS